jgi:hypothetical protein
VAPWQCNSLNEFTINNQTFKLYASFEAFTAVTIQVQVFWDVTPCSVVLGEGQNRKRNKERRSGRMGKEERKTEREKQEKG